jgi:HEAT repeat protein
VLSEVLKDPSPAPRAAAAAALGTLGDVTCAAKIAELLYTDGTEEVRVAAVTALSYLGAAGAEYHAQVAALIDANGATATMRAAAAEALSHMGEFIEKAAVASDAKALAGCLQDSKSSVRKAAATALGVLGQVTPDEFFYADDVAKLLYDASMEVRTAAAKSLSCLGEAGAKAAATTLEHVAKGATRKAGEADNGTVCHAAAQALGLGGEVGAAHAAALIRDGSSSMTVAAAEALGAAGIAAVPFIEDLLEVLRQRSMNWEARVAAAEALGCIGAPAASALADAMRHGDASCLAMSAKALVHIGDHSAAEAAASLLSDGNGAVRATAASVLGDLGDHMFADQVAELLDDCDSDVVCMATKAMSVFGVKGAAHACEIVELLHHDEARVRCAAAKTIGTIGLGSEASQGMSVLEATLERDSVDEVRAAATWAV